MHGEMIMVAAHMFWDRMAERYSKTPIADEQAYQKKLDVTRQYFRPDMDVLEFGCGTGSTAISHAPFVKHIEAIDFSSKMIDIARSKAARNNVGNVTFKRAGIDEFSAPDQTFDAVLGLSVLHLLENMDQVILKVQRMLKPGGVFVSSTACIADDMKFFKFIAPVGRLFGLIPVVKIFHKTDLQESLTNGGFEIDYQWQPGKGKGVFIVARKPVQS